MTDMPVDTDFSDPSAIFVVLGDIEADRHAHEGDEQLEDALSINEWVTRLQGGARVAHGLARAGSVEEEYRTWVELASICAARAGVLRRVIDGRLLNQFVEPPAASPEPPAAPSSSFQ